MPFDSICYFLFKMDFCFHVLTLNKSNFITVSHYTASISAEIREWNFRIKF
jgi:hypothetical protein